jgi:hypothetical protein
MSKEESGGGGMASRVAAMVAGRERLRQAGVRPCGSIPYHEGEPDAVRLAKRLREQINPPLSFRAIALELERQGFRNRKGNRYAAMNIKEMVDGPMPKGVVQGIESPPLAPVIPLRPVPIVHGWHGMRKRDQAAYRPEDWQIWAALGIDDARLIDVAPGSPAWLADLRDGAWITAINDMPFDGFINGAVGQIIEVRAQLPGVGPVIRKLVLVAPPEKKSKAPRQQTREPAWKLEPPVLPGKRVFKDSRPALLEFAARHPHVKRHVWLLLHLLQREWRKGIIVKHKTIAEAVKCHVSRVKRAQSCCQHFGFLRVNSGKRTRQHNSYEVCWPADAPKRD